MRLWLWWIVIWVDWPLDMYIFIGPMIGKWWSCDSLGMNSNEGNLRGNPCWRVRILKESLDLSCTLCTLSYSPRPVARPIVSRPGLAHVWLWYSKLCNGLPLQCQCSPWLKMDSLIANKRCPPCPCDIKCYAHILLNILCATTPNAVFSVHSYIVKWAKYVDLTALPFPQLLFI